MMTMTNNQPQMTAPATQEDFVATSAGITFFMSEEDSPVASEQQNDHKQHWASQEC